MTEHIPNTFRKHSEHIPKTFRTVSENFPRDGEILSEWERRRQGERERSGGKGWWEGRKGMAEGHQPAEKSCKNVNSCSGLPLTASASFHFSNHIILASIGKVYSRRQASMLAGQLAIIATTYSPLVKGQSNLFMDSYLHIVE